MNARQEREQALREDREYRTARQAKLARLAPFAAAAAEIWKRLLFDDPISRPPEEEIAEWLASGTTPDAALDRARKYSLGHTRPSGGEDSVGFGYGGTD